MIEKEGGTHLNPEEGVPMRDFLHVFGQLDQHSEVHIVGTIEGLTKLRDSINMALNGQADSELYYTNDGEGYDCIIVPVTGDVSKNVALPYTADWFREYYHVYAALVVWPHQLYNQNGD